jgi:transcriptional regulator with XRE-family HTH domain
MENQNISGKRIKSLRLEKGLSQEEVAQAIGVTKSTISKYERGENEPGMAVAADLASFFNVSMNYIAGTTDEKQTLSLGELEDLFLSLSEKDKLDAIKYIKFLKSNN